LDHPITLVLRARQEIELLKVPGAVEKVADLRADGHSVAIFCCYTQTVNEFCRRLDTQCKVVGISGPKDAEQRKTNVANFQSNHEQVIICSSAGDMGMGLHDLHGGHPRASIIFPDFSARNFIQRKGRVHRAGAKSKSIQYVPFAKGTVEEKPYKALKLKLSCMGALLDGLSDSDFNPFGPTVDIPALARQTDFDDDN
jgi:superfamily II DNA/RNA helicase